MNNLTFILLLTCGLFTSKEKQDMLLWQHKSATHKDSMESRSIENINSVSLPYVWKDVPCEILDGMISKSIVVSKRVQSGEQTASTSEPILTQLRDLIVLYADTRSVKVGKCNYQIQRFIANKGSEINEDDCYEFFYLKGFGILRCSHAINSMPSFAWDSYALADVRAKNGKSIANKERLLDIIEKIEKE